MVRLARRPTFHFAYANGQVRNLPGYNNPPGPFDQTRGVPGGVLVPENLYCRRVWVTMEVPGGSSAVGEIQFLDDDYIVESVPYAMHGSPYPATTFDSAVCRNLAGRVGIEDLWEVDLPLGGGTDSPPKFEVTCRCNRVTWIPNATYGVTNAASHPALYWSFWLAVLSMDQW